MWGVDEENAPRPDENCNSWHPGLSQIATQAVQPDDRLSWGKASWYWLRDGCGLSFVKGESDPKRCALVDYTLYIDGPAMFLDDAFHDRET